MFLFSLWDETVLSVQYLSELGQEILCRGSYITFPTSSVVIFYFVGDVLSLYLLLTKYEVGEIQFFVVVMVAIVQPLPFTLSSA